MNPEVWQQVATDYLEREGIIGTLLPQGAGGAADRYQPDRVSVRYGWCGDRGAATQIQFRVSAHETAPPSEQSIGDWSVVVESDEGDGWGREWELVTLMLPGGAPASSSAEVHVPNRFHISVSLSDTWHEEDERYLRTVELRNQRQQGGTLYSVRMRQSDLPELVQVRPFGIDEDIYYRASGLIGSLEDETLFFRPFAFLAEPERRPVRGPDLDSAVSTGLLDVQLKPLLTRRGARHLFQFQADAWADLRPAVSSPSGESFLLSGGTGGGKTEAFLFPLLHELLPDERHLGVKGVFVYPTKALESDQAGRFFEYLAQLNAGRTNPLTLAVLDGDTPFSRDDLENQEQSGELRTPFTSCPTCRDGHLRFSTAEDGTTLTTPRCSSCGHEYPWLRVDRQDVSKRWPHFLLTIPDMLHRLVSTEFAWMYHSMFGRQVHVCADCGTYTPSTHNTLAGKKQCRCGAAHEEALSLAPSLVVFDEAHLLKGLFGSQVSLLVARLRALTKRHGHTPVFAGVSATIGDPASFGQQLFGGEVCLIEGHEERDPALPPSRFHLFVMPVQVTVLNAIGHVLAGLFKADAANGETNRVLVFSDAKKTVYQLEASLPEFYASLDDEITPHGPPATESHTADLAAASRRQIESAFDARDIRVLLATQTLEVGVDFRALQLEVQAGATYSYNDYIQRVGRAGRGGVPALIVCVLRPQVPLDYYYYEHCRELVQFSPETVESVPIRSDNPFLIRRHAPAAIQDWLIAAEPGAQLMWRLEAAKEKLVTEEPALLDYLRECFLRPYSLDKEIIERELDSAVLQVRAALDSNSGRFTWERLKPVIELSIRATDASVSVIGPALSDYRGVSMSDSPSDETELEPDGPDAEDGPDIPEESA